MNFLQKTFPSLRNELRFKSRNIRTVRYGTGTAAFVGSRIWTNMPNELKESTVLNKFKSKIKTWKSETVHANSIKSTIKELVTFKLVISIIKELVTFKLVISICS